MNDDIVCSTSIGSSIFHVIYFGVFGSTVEDALFMSDHYFFARNNFSMLIHCAVSRQREFD